MKLKFTPEETTKLRLFRKVAADLHPYVLEYDGFPFLANLSGGESRLIPRDTVLAMAVHVRTAYMDGEPTHYDSIRGIVGNRWVESRPDMKVLKDSWHRVFQPKMVFTVGKENYHTRRIVETYFYGALFHRDEDRESDVESVAAFGDATWMHFQIAILNMALCILALDWLVAHALGEEPLQPPASRRDEFMTPEERGWVTDA